MERQKRIIVAVDVPELTSEVLDTLASLNETGAIAAFKVGITLMARDGHRKAADVLGAENIMLDPKSHDIPAQVAGAIAEYADMGFGLCTLHASGGHAMIEAAVEKRGNTKLLAVTVLTSLNDRACRGVYGDLPDMVAHRLTKIALESGVQGIVCSPKEVGLLRNLIAKQEDPAVHDTLIVSPGVRVDFGKGQIKDDQARVATPEELGANLPDLAVVGRDIMQAEKRHGMTPAQAALHIDEVLTRYSTAAQLAAVRSQLEG